MKYSKRQLLELRYAIGYLSQINKDSGFPVYDLGFAANLAMAKTINQLKAIVTELDRGQEIMRAKVADLRKQLVKPKDPHSEPESSKCAAANQAVEGKIRGAQDEWEETLMETVELELPQVAAADISCRGASPPPDVLASLDLIIE